MKKAVLILFAVVAAAWVAALFVPFEPDERRPGTRLGGQLAIEQDTDWSFRSEGRLQIFVETATWYGIPHSVTTTSWIHDGNLYVPCNDCASKRWPKNVARNPNVRLEVGDEIYERRAVKVEQADERRRAFAALTDRPMPPERWLFRMEARQARSNE